MSTDLKVRTFDAKRVIITFGTVTMVGFPEGTFVTITPSGPSFEAVGGADGTTDRVNKNADRFMIAVTLKRTSPTNQTLSNIHNADKLSNTGKLPFTVTDLGGTSEFFAPIAWIQGFPGAADSDGIETREWMFDTGIAVQNIGGNT